MSNLIQDIKQSLYKGFIDKDSSHKGNFVPRLLVNNKEENVLSTIIDQLHNCQSFCISVAFITESGLASLKSHFYDLSKKGVKGRIITSNYLGFNSPKMFEELLKLENVEVKYTNIEGFHAKGYIFEHHNHTSFIIGSSNLTSNALKLNYEHNLFLSTHKNGDLVNNIKYKFDELWDSSFSLTNEWINEYKQSFEYQTLQKVFDNTVVQNSDIKKFNESKLIKPNLMQEHALKSLESLRNVGEEKGLIISATGTGKTILCALDVRAYSPDKFLFIVHNEGILNRAETIQQLKEGSINYIITVDLFNEGIDIPEINQVVMLRPTKSSIIFIQQLGRGLRKSTNKEFVTVIDFIGNYKTNYMIPIALSGNKSQNKDNYRKFLTDTTVLNGVSTINFEEVAKNKIYNSLDSVKLNQPKLIKEAFNNVKDRIGKLPLLMDFINNDSIDPSVIFSRFKNYYEFLIKNKIIENELSINEFKNLTFLSRQLTPGLKKVDIDVLKEIIQNDVTYENLTKKMLNINNDISEYDINTSLSILDFTFFKKTIGKTYGLPLIQYKDNLICLANEFKEALNKPLFNTFVHDLIDLANYNNDRYQNKKNSLILYNKYSREDFVKLLNWDKDESGTINGYRMKHRTLPLFITYDKHENISDNTKYDDEFLSQDELKWYTRSNRKLTSPEVQNILKHEENNTDMYIFVKKRDDEGKYFYYLGKAKYIKGTEKQDYMPNGNSVVTMHLSMNTSIRDDIYRYIT
ncbi:DUF3427 domain-containing protein [Staphylococcus epidermidis]|uniref:DUF3427 domain-containing protein n=1 Tax=Staphylococcus epidermidis TaxID=1282 RepID=UPI00136A8E9E|nr:DUF3427 domain-containing protein [Staphylococcus epidermidis]NAN67342.1 DUF3427 domain-containing protein [Staphylococcus epidermidis]NAO04905.1 DUF3427 domain-containing protein [Staphylococcus epidermidis]NAO11005.1 DUF3427 domain-containing protein [Staphylococcus epidermidis]